jgi:glutamine amidotransferase
MALDLDICRLAAYLGSDLRLDKFLLEPPRGLLVQAREPSEGRYATCSADGFGIAWYLTEGSPASYTSPLPIWSDANLPHLARSPSGRLWLATVRSVPVPIVKSNTQPLCDDHLIFLHDGFLDNFSKLRRTVRDFLEPGIEEGIQCNTDSEYLFVLLRHLLSDDAQLGVGGALIEMFELLEGWLGEGRGLLNILVTEGNRIYAARHAFNMESLSLYYTIDDEAFPDGQLVASERLTESEFWRPVPIHHLLILDAENPPELVAL